MTILTDGIETVSPLLWLDYKSTRPSNTIVHELANGGTALTVRDAGARSCTLVLLFTDEDESAACEAMLARKGVQEITETGRATASMSYAVTGTISREYDADHEVWIVSADVIEVTQ